MNLKLVIEQWKIDNPESELPSDIPTLNYADFEEVCQDLGIKHYPTFEECNSLWNEMSDNLKISDKRKFAINRASQMSFELCKIPIHQQINAALGLYTPERCLYITKRIDRYRQEFHRLKTLIEKANTIQEIDNVLLNHHYDRI
ncbi:MAG: hypothetical protein KGZ71_09670 [Desulfobulbaceae bacterium]|nr:hypothetical protein [Desulfobulbaceae bacterium]